MMDESLVTVVAHPLIENALFHLRERGCDADTFQRYARLATRLLSFEVLRDVPLREEVIETPLSRTVAKTLGIGVVFVPVLRSGLAMLEAVRDFVPGSRVGFVGLERDERTAVARRYYSNMPSRLPESLVVVLDPMLATGGSATLTLDALREQGVRDLRLACIVAAPEGVRAVAERHPAVRLWTCALDERLDAHKFIVPGLGDFGDRFYGTADE